MRTLQEKYNAIQQGKFSKEHFLAEARMQQPQLVTQYNGYDDAVQILKNKGMIQEIASFAERFKEYSNDALTDMVINLSRYQGNEKEIEEVKAELQRRKQAKLNEVTPAQEKYRAKPSAKPTQFKQDTAAAKKMIDAGKSEKEVVAKYGQAAFNAVNAQNLGEAKLTEAKVYSFTLTYNDAKYVQRVLDDAGVDAVAKAGTFDDEVTIRAFDAMGLRRAKQALEADHFDINENVSEAKQPKATKKGLADYRYKPTNEMDKYPYEQILRGLRVELEVMGISGTPTPEEYAKALAKVSKNLAKDSIFYTNQVAGVNPKVDQHDQMITATAKNTVDTFNGMKKAALKEGFKKLIKKVLSESDFNDPDLYDSDEERDERRWNYNDHGDFGPETEFGDEPEDYEQEDEMFEMYGEDSISESAMGDIYQIAKEHDRFEHFVQAVEDEFGPVEDIAELEHIFNATRDEDDINYGDENFSDAFIDGEEEDDIPHPRGYEEASDEEDLYETRKAKSLSELLK